MDKIKINVYREKLEILNRIKNGENEKEIKDAYKKACELANSVYGYYVNEGRIKYFEIEKPLYDEFLKSLARIKQAENGET